MSQLRFICVFLNIYIYNVSIYLKNAMYRRCRAKCRLPFRSLTPIMAIIYTIYSVKFLINVNINKWSILFVRNFCLFIAQIYFISDIVWHCKYRYLYKYELIRCNLAHLTRTGSQTLYVASGDHYLKRLFRCIYVS